MHRRSLLIHPNDNVAVLLEPGQKGDNVVVNSKKIELLENIDFAHKILLVDLKPEDFVIKYGERIGHMMVDAKAGTWIHNHNMGCRRGKEKEGFGDSK